MSHSVLLDQFLEQSRIAFTEQSIDKIDGLLSEKLVTEWFFTKNGKKMVLKGGKKEFLKIYDGGFGRDQTYKKWSYTILKSRKTLFGKVKASLFFHCISKATGSEKIEQKHVEDIVCEVSNGRLKLLELTITTGELRTD